MDRILLMGRFIGHRNGIIDGTGHVILLNSIKGSIILTAHHIIAGHDILVRPSFAQQQLHGCRLGNSHSGQGKTALGRIPLAVYLHILG